MILDVRIKIPELWCIPDDGKKKKKKLILVEWDVIYLKFWQNVTLDFSDARIWSATPTHLETFLYLKEGKKRGVAGVWAGRTERLCNASRFDIKL